MGPEPRISDALQAYTYPVNYGGEKWLEQQCQSLTEYISQNKDFFSDNTNMLKGYIAEMLEFFAYSLKHPAFAEEREWRVVYRPQQKPSQVIVSSLETIGYLPQIVQKLPLENVPAEGLSGITPPELIDSIILGPTEHGGILYGAFQHVLEKEGFENIADKIITSGIPLRI